MVIRRVAPLSVAKVCGVLYVIIGIVLGAFFSLFAIIGSATAAGDSPGAAGIGMVMGAGAIIIFPILYGGMGFLMTLLTAWLYNVVAGMVGGIEVDIQ